MRLPLTRTGEASTGHAASLSLKGRGGNRTSLEHLQMQRTEFPSPLEGEGCKEDSFNRTDAGEG
jgi:hypothetical protein